MRPVIGVCAGFVVYGVIGLAAMRFVGPAFEPYKYMLLVACLIIGSVVGMASEGGK